MPYRLPVERQAHFQTHELKVRVAFFLDYTSRTKADIDYFGRDGILEMVYRNQPGIIVNDRLSYFKDNCRDFDYYTPGICVPNQPLQDGGGGQVHRPMGL